MKMAIAIMLLLPFAAAAETSDPSDVNVGRPADIPQDLFAHVRLFCARRHPENYDYRLVCETNQFNAIRALRGDKQ
jgi:hypothetical protein